MKKILTVLSVAAMLALGAQAKDYTTDVHVGIASADFEGVDSNKAAYNIGVGVTKTFENRVFTGVSFDLDYANLGSGTDLYGYGMDVKLGYNVWDKMNVYGIGSGKIHSVDGDTASGFGYGAGIEYPIYKNIIGAVEYKTYKMVSSNIPDYDYKTAGLVVKYTF